MRCFFMNEGHIKGVEPLTVSSDADAIKQGQALLRERADRFAGIEIWDKARRVYRSLISEGET
jgi:hypothetical protein